MDDRIVMGLKRATPAIAFLFFHFFLSSSSVSFPYSTFERLCHRVSDTDIMGESSSGLHLNDSFSHTF